MTGSTKAHGSNRRASRLMVAIAALSAVLLLGAAGTASAAETLSPFGPSITSDKADYAPGEHVVLRAGGFQPRESGSVVVEDDQDEDLPMVKRTHPDLGRLGVFWHTQGSGKSYSMAFFAEKVRRVVPGNFTFLVMTDREDLDDQIWRTFTGCRRSEGP